ncbi:MAG: RagB/SusD family nutrient uptake outer membrane protein [Proteiniphilum sp.]|nr:RagB/SusD family nutrient uptake outer membrane protein [Proteiniphilum sp.]
MNKYIYLLAAIILGSAVSSCYELDLEPKGIFDEGTLFNSDYGIRTYFGAIYNELPIEDFNYYQNKGYASANDIGNYWEGQKNSPAVLGCEAAGRREGEGTSEYWPYERIRRINNFIAAIPAYSDYHSEEQINEYLGEAHFLRAFYYFGMVKRYGGVPLIDELQDPAAPIEELRTPRSTEYDSWKFIYEDLKFAMENMAETSIPGRANRYSAAALMTRAMLYAGSSGSYFHTLSVTGPAVEAGLMGMDEVQAAEFYGYVIEAAQFVEEGGYSLHDGANKEVAFTEVFTTLNKEDLFVKLFGPNNSNQAIYNSRLHHCWDTMVLPLGTGLASDVGSALHPAWDLIKLYQMPALAEENENGEVVPVRFNSLNDLWQSEEMEPRARGTFFFSGMTEVASGEVMDLQAGVYRRFPGTLADATANDQTNDYMELYRIRTYIGTGQIDIQTVDGVPDVKINGLYGISLSGGDEGRSLTGAFIRKYVNPEATAGERGLYLSSTPFKVLRYAEVLLNRAEALYELGLLTGDEGLKAEAFEYINQVRNRAGARHHDMVVAPKEVGGEINALYSIDENRQFIRDERARELAFENHRFFDLRRWRVLHSKVQDFYHRGLMGYYVVDEGKYIFLNDREKENRGLGYNRANYYQQIPGGQINRNPNLIRNDGH